LKKCHDYEVVPLQAECGDANNPFVNFLKNKNRETEVTSVRLPFFRPRPSLIPLFRGRKDKKVGEIFGILLTYSYLSPMVKIGCISEIKEKNRLFLCISLNLHYLCSVKSNNNCHDNR